MKTIQLTAKEFVYISLFLGAENIYGIPDPFIGMSQDDIIEEIQSIHTSLVNRGIFIMDFMDNLSVSEDVKELIEISAFCDNFLVCTYPDGDKQVFFTTYLKDGKTIILKTDGTDFTLNKTCSDDIKKLILTAVQNAAPLDLKAPTDNKTAIPYDVIKKAKEISADENISEASELLISHGVDEETAGIIIDGFMNNIKSVVIMGVNPAEQKDIIIHSFISSDRIVLMTENNGGKDDSLIFEADLMGNPERIFNFFDDFICQR